MAELPCRNPNCKSEGIPHPHCKCYGPSMAFADGGQVCQGVHEPGCEYAKGGEVQMMEHPQMTLDHAAAHHGLHHLLTKTGFSKSEDPNKATQDHLEASGRGHKKVKAHIDGLFDKMPKHEMKDREALKKHLDHLNSNPEELLNVGGNLAEPHGAQLAALAGTAVNHFNALKPQQAQGRPLDEVAPPDKLREDRYNRSLDIAENPLSALHNVQDGTLHPQELNTLTTLYPALTDSLKKQAFEALVKAKTDGKEIPYKQKQSLSMLLGEPLDSTMTTASRQAIIRCQGPQQIQNQKKNQAPKKATGIELKQINKVNALNQTDQQARQIAERKE